PLDVQNRLERTFPGLTPSRVQQMVAESYRTMTGPIRDFVPLLVEHQARDVLAAARNPSAPIDTAASPASTT
ncbi:MAG: hypothetical protein M3Y44_08570, partial [Actinomycetota bacterium]|nr:hypothetical protein [Actinomycetota bacterium]